jgi:hypothetical protein
LCSIISKLIADCPNMRRGPEVGDPEIRECSHRCAHQFVILDGAKLPSLRRRGENSLETRLRVRDDKDLLRAPTKEEWSAP